MLLVPIRVTILIDDLTLPPIDRQWTNDVGFRISVVEKHGNRTKARQRVPIRYSEARPPGETFVYETDLPVRKREQTRSWPPCTILPAANRCRHEDPLAREQRRAKRTGARPNRAPTELSPTTAEVLNEREFAYLPPGVQRRSEPARPTENVSTHHRHYQHWFAQSACLALASASPHPHRGGWIPVARGSRASFLSAP